MTRRFSALDGLRGIAALVVVLHHALLTSPALATAYQRPGANLTGAALWLTYTPLHLLWAGGEAVIVFFVLSGFVLMLPLTDRAGRWRSYYPQRLARLYLPVAGAVVLSILWVSAVPRHPVAGASWWVNAHGARVALGAVANDLVLLHHTPGFLNAPLWSLRWEVWFSLLLPAYVVIAKRQRSLWTAKVAALLCGTAIGAALGNPALTYLPMFGVGAVMAVERETLRGWGLRLHRRGWVAVTVAGLLLLDLPWTAAATNGTSGLASGAVHAGVLLGAALTLFVVFGWPAAAHAGEARPVQWLGSRSFSLYLVHEPLIVSVALLAGPHPLAVLAVGVPLSLALADLFYRLVERPAHRLSKRIGQVMARPVSRQLVPSQENSIVTTEFAPSAGAAAPTSL